MVVAALKRIRCRIVGHEWLEWYECRLSGTRKVRQHCGSCNRDERLVEYKVGQLKLESIEVGYGPID